MSQQAQPSATEAAVPVTKRKPWQWVPTAYFYQAIPNTVMQSLIVYFYIAMNVNPKVSGVAVSLLYLPWFIKPLWGPIVDILKTKKWWAMWMQIVVGIGFAATALLVPALGADSGKIFAYTLIPFILIALSAATYDVASDGMYMINLNPNQQSIWVGLRSTAFRVGWLLVDGGMLWLVGYVAGESAKPLSDEMLWAWQVTFYVLAAITFVTAAYNFWAFPQDPHRAAQEGVDVKTVGGIVREFGRSVVTFMQKPNIVWGILFLVLYRTGEAQLLQILPSFFTDPVENGGLEIPMEAQGLIKLKNNSLTVTRLDIVDNPKKLKIEELEAAQLVRSLPDVDLSIINGNYALLGGLNAADALATESSDSEAANAYANVLAVRAGDEKRPELQALVDALKSEQVREYMNKTYRGAVVPK